jgi:hypothetical protein
MKRLLAVLTLALLVSLAVGAGVAYADHGTDYARGTVDQGANEWRFSASSNFNGTQPQGTVRLIQENSDPNVVITGNVTCLLVVSNPTSASASIVAEVTDVRGAPSTFAQSLIIHTTDFGKFSPARDTFLGSQSGTPATEVCPPPSPFQSPVLSGEVVVHDSAA